MLKITDSIVIIVLTFGIMLFGVTFTIASYAENGVIAEINREITAGMLTSDTISHFQTALNLWKTAPIFLIIGMCLYFWERSKGADLPASTYFEYEILMIVALYMSLFMTWVYGLTMDSIYTPFETQRFLNDINPMWERTEVIAVCQRMAYLGCLLPGYVGSFLYMIHPIIQQKDNTFFDVAGGSEDNTDEEYTTPYTLQQF